MKKHLYIAYIAYLTLVSSVTCLLCSCSGGSTDEPTSVTPEQPVTPGSTEPVKRPMGFFPTESPVSRGSSPLEETYQLFKVWAYKHMRSSSSSNSAQTQTVMPGYQVKYLNQGWQYDGTSNPSHTELDGQFLKYWDASSSSYDFYAYAPVNIPEGVSFTFDPMEGFTISGLPSHSADYTDFVVAKQTRFLPYESNTVLKDIDALVEKENDPQPGLFYDPIPLVFHHILSKVEYRIYNTGTQTAVINNIFINYDEGKTLNTKGDFKNGSWTNFNAKSNTLMSLVYIEPDQLKLAPIKKENYQTDSESLITYYEIPQTLNQYITVSVDIDGEVISKRFDLSELHTYQGWATEWDYDTYYVYYIHLDVGDSGNPPILIELSVNDFEPGEPLDDTQTNW